MSFGDDDDGFGIMFLLPWWMVIPLLIVLLGIFIYDKSLSPEEHTAKCAAQASKYHMESKWEEAFGCLVKTGDKTWKAIQKFEKDGVITE